MRLIDIPEFGPACRFTDAHLYYALSLLKPHEHISRQTLSQMANIGEGSIRTILKTLGDWKAISTNQMGVMITPLGTELLNSIPIRLVNVDRSDYVIGAYQQGILVRNIAHKITNGMYQRDRGIIAGANGGSVFMMRNGILMMPKSWNMDVRDPEFAKHLRDKGMQENDIILICGASNVDVAILATISIALDLL